MPEPPANDPPSAAAPTAGATPDDDDVLGGDAPPTDDSPTVVSKSPPSAASAPDAAFAGGLRGRKLAHFELIEAVGVGGMAAVIRARDTQLDRFVALKILPPEMAKDPENVRRFHQEARSAAKLDHENIARVFFCGEDQRLHFIAFEYVEGENLRTLVDRRGRLPFAEAAHYVLQVAAGLAHAALRGVVHRDIKPSNILVTPAAKAKLVDMGLARSLEPHHDGGLTQSGVTLGTFDYISPEQALEPRDADIRSDLYSLGCTFYHLVTGQPPVPEGTAARKLHHHQQVRPVDPRELAPDLPDGLAVVIGRMIAKKPGDRYQSAEELIDHLLLAMREAGATPEPPAGLPAAGSLPPPPPRGRPLALAAVLTLAVVALVFLLSPSGAPQPPSDLPRGEETAPTREAAVPGPAPAEGVGKAADPAPAVGNAVARPAPAPAEARFVLDRGKTPRDLAEWAEANKGKPLVVEVAADQDTLLTVGGGGDNPGLVVRGGRVTVRARPGGPRPTLYLASAPVVQREAWAALTVEADDNVTVEGLRFVVEARGAQVAMAGLHLKGGRALVRDCEFVQASPALEGAKRVASVLAEAGRTPAPQLSLVECCFLAGQELYDPAAEGRASDLVPRKTERGGRDAVARRGAVKVEAVRCAFGPHAADFRLEGGTAAGRGPAVLARHCSMLLVPGSAVFQPAARADAALDVEACLVSRADPPAAESAGGMMPTTMADAERGAVLVRQEGAGAVTYTGRDNRYHNLDAFWWAESGGDAGAYDAFVGKIRESGGRDERSQVLTDAGPWLARDPIKELEKSPPALAFRVNDLATELRVEPNLLVGTDRVTGERLAPATLPAPQLTRPGPAPRQTLVVDPVGGVGVYRSLEKALPNANPGDVIEVRHDGPLTAGQLSLPPKLDLTIRAAAGRRPRLTLDDPRDTDQVLFKLYDGSLRLEGLDFLLKPSDNYRSQAVVSLPGEGHCEFKNCTVTLEQNRRTTELAVAVLPAAGGMMMRPDAEPASGRSREQGPLLRFQGCLVRGEGDGVRGRGGRPFEFDAQDTVAVLTGSLLNVEAAPAPAESTGPGGTLVASLRKVTTYLANHLLRIQGGKESRGLPPVQWNAENCLFVAARGRSMIRLADGPDARGRVAWTGRHNAYGNLGDAVVDQESAAAPPVGRSGWADFASDSDSRFVDAVRFNATPPAAASYPAVRRSDMDPVDPSDFGATPAAGR